MTIRFGLSVSLLTAIFPLSICAQDKPAPQVTQATKTVYAKTTTARIAAPDELVNVNGTVMRVADVVAILSSSTLSEPHPRIPEKRNSSDVPQIQPESKKHSD